MRYLPLTEQDRAEMRESIGISSVDELYKNVPEDEKVQGLLDLPLHKGEMQVEKEIAYFANQNHAASDGPFFLGAGSYYHHIPATVDHLIQRSEFLTAYTPYQPEISQGTLIAIFEFQTMIANLTGQDIANASMYDGATSVAEAALMARRITKRHNIHIHGNLNPEYQEVLETFMSNHEEVTITKEALNNEAACIIVQTPDFLGEPQSLTEIRKQCDETGALLIVAITEIVSLGLLPAPNEADIVAGEAQSIGVPMSFGGPYLGFFACKQKYLRQMPGRLCGQTTDEDGKRAFVLTLNTREQHIRREKATSNICTNQGLCALAFTIHMSLLGEVGLKQLARINHERAITLSDALKTIAGITQINEQFFNEFAIELPVSSETVVANLAKKGIIAGLPFEETKLLVTATEMTSDEDIATFVKALTEELA